MIPSTNATIFQLNHHTEGTLGMFARVRLRATLNLDIVDVLQLHGAPLFHQRQKYHRFLGIVYLNRKYAADRILGLVVTLCDIAYFDKCFGRNYELIPRLDFEFLRIEQRAPRVKQRNVKMKVNLLNVIATVRLKRRATEVCCSKRATFSAPESIVRLTGIFLRYNRYFNLEHGTDRLQPNSNAGKTACVEKHATSDRTQSQFLSLLCEARLLPKDKDKFIKQFLSTDSLEILWMFSILIFA